MMIIDSNAPLNVSFDLEDIRKAQILQAALVKISEAGSSAVTLDDIVHLSRDRGPVVPGPETAHDGMGDFGVYEIDYGAGAACVTSGNTLSFPRTRESMRITEQVLLRENPLPLPRLKRERVRGARVRVCCEYIRYHITRMKTRIRIRVFMDDYRAFMRKSGGNQGI